MPRTYRTKNIEQAATIQAVTGFTPEIIFDETGLACFCFPVNDEVISVVMRYDSGIPVDARSVLTIRNQLYKRIKGGR